MHGRFFIIGERFHATAAGRLSRSSPPLRKPNHKYKVRMKIPKVSSHCDSFVSTLAIPFNKNLLEAVLQFSRFLSSTTCSLPSCSFPSVFRYSHYKTHDFASSCGRRRNCARECRCFVFSGLRHWREAES